MNRSLSTFFAALFAFVLSSHATVLLDDSWLDGTRTNTNLPEESAWLASTASSLTATTNVMTGTIPTSSSRHWWTYFTSNANDAATLDIGETLRVTLGFIPSGVAPLNNNTSLRFGLFNSNGGTRSSADGSNPAGAGFAGYALFMNFGSTLRNNPLLITERTNVGSASLISNLPDFLTLGSGGGTAGAPGFTNGTAYTLQLSALRNADSIIVSTKISDTNGWTISQSGADINGLTTAFDTFVIFSPRGSESATTFQFTRMKVEKLSASVAVDPTSHSQFVAVSNAFALVNFLAAPDSPVEVQRSIDLTNWIALMNTNAPGTGLLEFLDDFADLGSAPAQAFYRLKSLVPIAPSILAQPEDTGAAAGDDVALAVNATGSEPMIYQWYFNSVPIANATNATLFLTNVQLSNAGNYSAFVANDAGSVVSDTANLSVFTAPQITVQPQSLSATETQTVLFNVTAIGAAPLHYQWFFNTNTPLANATNSSLVFTDVPTNAAGAYSVVVTNSLGAVTSVVAMLTVNPSNTPPDFSVVGFATVNGNITGGQAGATVTVSNAADLNFYLTQTAPYTVRVQGTISFNSISVRSSKTIIGDGTNATLIGSLRMSGVTNVIARNLFISNPSGVGSGDGISIDNGARHIWIDHCTFYDCADGALDITQASDFVTVSWCRFFYTANTGHNFVNLIGADDSNIGDRGKLRVTFHHNWWSTLCVERMPRVRFGQVHVYNNFFNSPGNNYCVRAAIESQLLIENNHFQSVKSPYVKYITTGPTGKIKVSGNSFASTSGSIDPGTDTVFIPPYSLTMDAPENLPNLITNYAGAGKVSF